jgi:hypothetical protein
MATARPILLGIVLLALAGCGGGGSETDASDAHAEGVEVQPADTHEASEATPDAPDSADARPDDAEQAEVPPDIEDTTPEADVTGVPCTTDAPCRAALGHADDVCGKAWCDPERGVCDFDFAPDITPCGEAPDSCHSAPRCVNGTCRADLARPRLCDDGNPCTTDDCHDGGCVHAPVAAYCDDHDPCTVQDRCLAGVCLGNPKPGCACLADLDCAPFDDDDPCTGELACLEGTCRLKPGSLPACDTWPAPPCQAWVCNGGSGDCVLAGRPDDQPCDDGNPCTLDEACFFGECYGVNLCTCAADADCAPYDDGDACNGALACRDGACEVAPGSVVLCGDPAGLPCTRRSCDPTSGQCVTTPAHDDAPCLDLDACTTGEVCAAGQCGGGESRACDDLNPCTADFCASDLGCLHQNLDAACDDGNPCTKGEYCQAGMCLTADASVCNDHNACTDDLCDAGGGCQFVNNEQPCDDGNPCSGPDVCAAGACRGGGDVCGACDDDLDCDAFDDADLCNGLLRCLEGLCKVDPATVVQCPTDADTACLTNRCDPTTAQCALLPANEGKPCDDASACTDGDVCTLGACGGVAHDCDDLNPCTADTCDATGACVQTPNALPCDDGNPCTGGDTCAAAACQPGALALCGQTCATDTDCSAVDDGNPCTGLVRCLAGACAFDPASVVVCPTADDSACRKSTCQPATGVCELQALPDGAACNDQNPCTAPDTCTAGFCSGPGLDCDDANGCTADSCSIFYGCVHFHHQKPCEDGNACTVGDRCADGACRSGGAADCDDASVCTVDACDPSLGCTHDDLTAEWCSDGLDCTSDRCDAVLGCVHEVICAEFCTNHQDDDLDGKTDCNDPDCLEEPACTGEGECVPVGPLACESSVQGDLADASAPSKMFAYAACTFQDYPGPELTYSFTAACDAKITLMLDETAAGAVPLLDLFVLEDEDGVCAAVNCAASAKMQNLAGKGQATLLFNAEALKPYYVVVDGRNGDVGTFNLLVSCECL